MNFNLSLISIFPNNLTTSSVLHNMFVSETASTATNVVTSASFLDDNFIPPVFRSGGIFILVWHYVLLDKLNTCYLIIRP
jgi:hypothetical protein